jgi:geranylgeranyl reductase family protein
VSSAEVVIVGAGPAGSALALLLAQRGREVLLVDQARFPRDKPCGEYLNPAAVSILARLGMTPELRAAGAREVVGTYLTSPAGRAVRVPYPPPDAGAPPYGLSVPRLALDAALLRAAQSAGVQVREQFRVDDLLRSERRIAGVVGRDTAGRREVRARIVVGADGSRSLVARRLGLARPPRSPRRFGLVAHYEGVEGDDWVEMHAGRRGYCGLGYSTEGGANVAMVAEPADLPRLQGRAELFFVERLAEFPAVARRLAQGRRVGGVMVTGSMSSRAAAVSRPGLLLVGDAAGFYDPFTGEGISYALRAAELAADAVDMALGSRSSEGLSVSRDWDQPHDRPSPALGHDLGLTPIAAREAAAFREYARRRKAEFGPRLLVSSAIQGALMCPWLLEALFRRFETEPALLQRLIGVTAGVLPPKAVLTPGYVASLLVGRAVGGQMGACREEPARQPHAANVGHPLS